MTIPNPKGRPRPYAVCCEDGDGIHPLRGFRYATLASAESALGDLDCAMSYRRHLGLGGWQRGWHSFVVIDMREAS